MLSKGSLTRDEWNNLLHLLNIMNFSRHFLAATSFVQTEKQSVMSKRSQGDLSDNSPTVKAKSKSMNLVSHRNLSIASQNSQNTSDPKILVSDRTDKLSASYEKSERSSTDESLFLRSPERSKGNTCKIGSELSEQDMNSSGSGKVVR